MHRKANAISHVREEGDEKDIYREISEKDFGEEEKTSEESFDGSAEAERDEMDALGLFGGRS